MLLLKFCGLRPKNCIVCPLRRLNPFTIQYENSAAYRPFSPDGGFNKLPRYRTFRLLVAVPALRLVKFRCRVSHSPCTRFEYTTQCLRIRLPRLYIRKTKFPVIGCSNHKEFIYRTSNEGILTCIRKVCNSLRVQRYQLVLVFKINNQ